MGRTGKLACNILWRGQFMALFLAMGKTAAIFYDKTK